jgi:predicted methyltransferase
VALTACGSDDVAQSPAPAAAEPAASTAVATIDPAILDHAARSEDDHYRDAGFRPLEVYQFLGIEPGQRVADLMPGGGYNTVLVSQIVGAGGSVVAVLRPTASDSAERVERAQTRFAAAIEPFGLDNLETVASTADLPDNSVDLLLTVRNYHDIGLAADRVAALPEFLRILKPGGTFAVIDAYTDKPDERDESVHRINDDLAQAEITSAGFEFVDASDLLVNPEDTFDFDGREVAGRRDATEDAPIHRYYVSRFVHKYRKPLQ